MAFVLPPRVDGEPVDLDALVLPPELLPDRTMPAEESLRRSREREAWFRARGLGKAPGDYVRRRNAEIRSRELHGIPEQRRDTRSQLYREWTAAGWADAELDDHDHPIGDYAAWMSEESNHGR